MADNFEYLANLFDGLVDKDDFVQRKKDGVELLEVSTFLQRRNF